MRRENGNVIRDATVAASQRRIVKLVLDATNAEYWFLYCPMGRSVLTSYAHTRSTARGVGGVAKHANVFFLI